MDEEDTKFFWMANWFRLVSCGIVFLIFTIVMCFTTPEPKLLVPAFIALAFYTGFVIFWYFQFYKKAIKS